MTTPVAAVAISWDGHDIQPASLAVHFRITEGIDSLPEYRGSDALIPFRAGQLPGLRIPHSRPIVAVGHVMGDDGVDLAAQRAAYRSCVDQVKGWMDPEAGEKVLSLTLEDGSTRWITCAARNVVAGTEQVPSELRAFSLEWEAIADPMWHAAWGGWTADAGLFADAGLYADESTEVVIWPILHDPTSETFTALGTADTTDVVVEIDGPSAAAVTITTLSTATAVGFTHVRLNAGQTLVVDAGARSALIGTTNARRNLSLLAGNEHGEYLRLRAGSNTIQITGRPAQVRLAFNRTYR